jgi:hypothetical protein
VRYALVFLLLAACSGAPEPFSAEQSADTTVSTSIYRWDSGQQTPTTIGYTPTANFDASHCELWVNGFGNGNFENGGFTNNWIEAYISAPRPGDKLLNVGLFVRAAGRDGRVTQNIVLGSPIATSYYATGFYFTSTSQKVDLTVRDFAFFVDVERPSGQIVRLWQSAGGHNYGMTETFALPPSGTKELGGGEVVYANEAAQLFDQKHACR